MLTVLMPLKNYHPEFLAKGVGSIFDQDSAAWRLLIVVERGDLSSFREVLTAALAHGACRC